MMQAFYPENIPIAISAFRSDNAIPALDSHSWDGGQCRIFKAVFPDGESWSIRVPIHMRGSSQDTIISILQGEQDVLQRIKSTGFPWAPKHHGSNFTFENEVGFPFLVLSWVEGCPLRWTTSCPPRQIRDKILRQVAEIQLSLIECTKDNSKSSLSFLDGIFH